MLAGINTRWVIMKVFILMGVLCAIAGAVATARLNAATNALGTHYELYVIAATVIGGTSFAGGIGTVFGADARRAGHAIAAVGHGADGRRVTAAEHRLGHGSGHRGRHRHRLPPASGLTKNRKGTVRWLTRRTPLVEMRNIYVSFGGMHAVENATIDLMPARSSVWSAATAPASPP